MTRDLNSKEYRAMERFLGKELEAGKEVYVDIKVGYPDSPSATRPNIISVHAKINGRPKIYKFKQ